MPFVSSEVEKLELGDGSSTSLEANGAWFDVIESDSKANTPALVEAAVNVTSMAGAAYDAEKLLAIRLQCLIDMIAPDPIEEHLRSRSRKEDG